jgi:hypothetical protein
VILVSRAIIAATALLLEWGFHKLLAWVAKEAKLADVPVQMLDGLTSVVLLGIYAITGAHTVFSLAILLFKKSH